MRTGDDQSGSQSGSRAVRVGEAISYPEPLPELKKFSVASALKVFGPGAIMASITIGSGETIFSSRGGAVFGYAILWTFVLGMLLKGAMMYATNRYITITGEHPMNRWGYVFPGPRGWFPLIVGIFSVGSFPFWAGGLSLAIGDLTAGLLFGEGQIWATVFIIVAATMAWAGGYDVMEKAQTMLVGFMIVAVLIGVFVAQPDWLAALGGLIPNVPSYDGWLQQKYPAIAARPVWVEVVTYIGAIGGGTYDYIGYTGMLREKQWGMLGHKDVGAIRERFNALRRGEQLPLPKEADEVRKAKAWTLAPLGDVLVSATAVALFGIAFAINGANILNDQRLVPAEDRLLEHQAQFLTVIHPVLEYLWYIAVFTAFFGTLYGLWEVYSFTAYETVGAVSSKIRRSGVENTRRWVYPYVLIAGLLLVWTGWDPVTIVTLAAIVGGALTVGLFALATLYTERRVLPSAYRMRGFTWGLVLVSGIVLTIFGVIAFLSFIGVLPEAPG